MKRIVLFLLVLACMVSMFGESSVSFILEIESECDLEITFNSGITEIFNNVSYIQIEEENNIEYFCFVFESSFAYYDFSDILNVVIK